MLLWFGHQAGAVRPLARGVIVVADSGSRGAATLEAGHFRKVIPHMPYELKVGNYTSQEFDSALESYKASELMSSELSPSRRGTLASLSK